MKRFFGGDDRDEAEEKAEAERATERAARDDAVAPAADDAPATSAVVTTGPGWQVPLAPARPSSGGERPAERRDRMRDDIKEAPVMGPAIGGPEARIDILLSVTRSFRDLVADRLDDFGRVLDRMSDQMQEQRSSTATSLRELDSMVSALNKGFAGLSSELLGLSQRLTAVLAELQDYDLRAASDALAGGLEEMRRQIAHGDAQVDDMRRHVESQVAALLDRLRADIDASLGSTNEEMAELAAEVRNLDQEVKLLRRRMAITGRDRQPPPPEATTKRR